MGDMPVPEPELNENHAVAKKTERGSNGGRPTSRLTWLLSFIWSYFDPVLSKPKWRWLMQRLGELARFLVGIGLHSAVLRLMLLSLRQPKAAAADSQLEI